MRRAARAALLAAVGAIAAGLSSTLRAQARPTMIAQTRPIPNVVGMTLDSAVSALAWTHLRIVQIESLAAQRPPNTVIAQRPAANMPVASARAETLYWASRPKKVVAGIAVQNVRGVLTPSATAQTTPPPAVPPTDSAPTKTTHVPIAGVATAVIGTIVQDFTRVPDLRGRTPQEVAQMLEGLRLSIGNQARDYSDDIPSGRVFRQHPEASRSLVPTRTKVDVWYSIGPHPVATTIPVPSVVGLALANAASTLRRTNLRLGHVDTTFVHGASGAVIDQTPHAGSQAHAGDAVDVALAFPAQTVTVPPIIGLSRDSARAKLRAVKLDLGRVTLVSVQGRDTVVIDQKPGAGTQVDPGTLVSIVENRPPVRRQVQVPDLRGMTRDEAELRLRQDSLVLVASFANDFPSPVVVAQDPPATQLVYVTTAVSATLEGKAPPATSPQPTRPDSTGSIPQSRAPAETTAATPQPAPLPLETRRYVHVPPVVGLTVHDARSALADSGLTQLVLEGDSISGASVVVSQSPRAGDLILIGQAVALRSAVNANRVPTLVGHSEGDAHAEASNHNLLMNVQGRRRALRWTERVVQQTPRPLAPVPADRTVNVDLEVPIVPPLPTAIVLAVGAVAAGVRQKSHHSSSHKLGFEPETDVPTVPRLRGDAPSLIRTSIRLAYEPGAEPWKLEPSDRSLIKKQESRDA